MHNRFSNYFPGLRDCKPRDYLTSEVFPTMIPALNQMLRVAKVTEVSTLLLSETQRLVLIVEKEKI